MSQAIMYSNVLVKVGAERSHLLSDYKLKALTECKSLKDFASELRETIYREKLAKITQPYTPKKIERVLRENLIEVYCKIVQNSPRTVSQFLRTHLLKFELENIKNILRAASVGLAYEERTSRIHMFLEDFLKRRDIITKAAMAINVKSTVDALSDTSYGSLLRAGLRKYEEAGSTKFFDILLDRMFHEQLGKAFRSLPEEERKHALFYVSMETDCFNLITILRAKILNYDPHWIRMAISRNFYNIPEQTIETLLIAKDFEAALNIMRQSYYHRFFVESKTPEEIVSAAERSFRKDLVEYAKKTKIGDIFNIGTLLGFMIQKEAEVYNLTAISLGIEYGWNPDNILRVLL